MRWNLVFIVFMLLLPIITFVPSDNVRGYINDLDAIMYSEDFSSLDIDDLTHNEFDNGWLTLESYGGSIWDDGDFSVNYNYIDGSLNKFFRLEADSNSFLVANLTGIGGKGICKFSIDMNMSTISSSTPPNNENYFTFLRGSTPIIEVKWYINATQVQFSLLSYWSGLPHYINISKTDLYNFTSGFFDTSVRFGFQINANDDVMYYVFYDEHIDYQYITSDMHNGNGGFYNMSMYTGLPQWVQFNIKDDNVFDINSMTFVVADDGMLNSFYDSYGQLRPMGTMHYSGEDEDNPEGKKGVIPDDSEVKKIIVLDTDSTNKRDGFIQNWYVGTNWNGETESFNIYCIAEFSPLHTSTILPLLSAKLTLTYGGYQLTGFGEAVVNPTHIKWRNPKDTSKWLTVYRLSWFDLNSIYDGYQLAHNIDFRVQFTLQSNVFHVWAATTNEDWNGDRKGRDQFRAVDFYNFPLGLHTVQRCFDSVHWIGYDLDDGGGTDDSTNTFTMLSIDRNVAAGNFFECRFEVNGDNSFKSWIELTTKRSDSFYTNWKGGQDGLELTYECFIPSDFPIGTCYFHLVDSYLADIPGSGKTFLFNVTSPVSSNWGLSIDCERPVPFGSGIGIDVNVNSKYQYKVTVHWTNSEDSELIYESDNMIRGKGVWTPVHFFESVKSHGSYHFSLINTSFIGTLESYVENKTIIRCVSDGDGGGEGKQDYGRISFGASYCDWRVLYDRYSSKYVLEMTYLCRHANMTLRLSNTLTSSYKIYDLTPNKAGTIYYGFNNAKGWEISFWVNNRKCNGTGTQKIYIVDPDDGHTVYDSDGTYNEGAFLFFAGIGVMIGFMIVPMGIFRDNAFVSSSAGIIMPMFGVLGLSTSVIFGLMQVWTAFIVGFVMVICLTWYFLRNS